MLAVDAYRGCDFGCALCVGELSVIPRPGLTLTRVVSTRRKALVGGWIKIGEPCDAYPRAEDAHGSTRKLLRVAVRLGLGVEIFTRSWRVLRDLDVLRALHSRGALRITIKVPPAERALTLALEPGLGPAPDRLELIQDIARVGLPVGVLASPLYPGGGDERRYLGHLICAADEAGASYVSVAPLRFEPQVRERLLKRLASVDPKVADRVQRCFRARTWSPGFAERVQTAAAALCRTYRVGSGPRLEPLGPRRRLRRSAPPSQFPLFEAA